MNIEEKRRKFKICQLLIICYFVLIEKTIAESPNEKKGYLVFLYGLQLLYWQNQMNLIAWTVTTKKLKNVQIKTISRRA